MNRTIKGLMGLSGRTAIITGATGYLGRTIAETLAELGADLILVDRPGSSYQHQCESLAKNYGANVLSRDCDLEDQCDRQKFLAWVRTEYQAMNILVNNAAFAGGEKLTGWGVPFEAQSIESWRRAIEVNLTAAFELCQGLTPLMSTSLGASIINIGSIYGLYGPDWRLYSGTTMGNPAAYAASKGGLLQLTTWLSTTLAPKIRVNAISPGGIYRDQPPEFIEKYVSKTPLQRMATEDDFRGVTAYLASDLSSYVTGQNISVDGGFGAW